MAATPPNSSRFLRLANVWRCLALRSDIDDIILGLLGRFSLEKLYADAGKRTYQRLVSSLLVQLNVIFYIQRFSLPSEDQQTAPYLGVVASWEVIVRSVEFVLQVIIEGREGLWEAQTLRDRHLAKMLLSSLRILALHPKPPGSQRVRDRRDRFSRIHRSLERLYDNYPGPKSFLLSICKEVTHALLTDPSSLALPSKMQYELPNLASEMYPLPECVSAKYVSTIVPESGHADRWLAQYLALRDVAHFVVAASIQYTVNGETRDRHLQSASGKTRNAVLTSLDNLRMPQQFSKVELLATFSDIFQIILLDTPTISHDQCPEPGGAYECEADALDALCRSLTDRQMLQRVSDRQMMQSVGEITRDIALLDDPSGRSPSNLPRVYALNCQDCHLAGDTQLKYLEKLEFPDPGHGAEINLPEDTKCVECGETVTVAREISLARRTWQLLRPLQPNAESISAERHLPGQFHLTPPKNEPGMAYNSSYGDDYDRSDPGESPVEPAPLFSIRPKPGDPQMPPGPGQQPSIPPEERRPSASTINNPAMRYGPESPTSASGPFSSERIPTIEETVFPEQRTGPERSRSVAVRTPGPPSSIGGHSPSGISGTTATGGMAGMSRTVSSSTKKSSPFKNSSSDKKDDKKESKSRWPTFLHRRDSRAQTVETSSISTESLERQKLEEISLKPLLASTRSHAGPSGKQVNVYLSYVSTQALFWSQAAMQIWDIGTSPPTFLRAISTEGSCIRAAIAKTWLAYITGPREQKFTLRIMNLTQPDTRVAEYHMTSSQRCTSLVINPHENFVVAGFDNSTIRFFQIGRYAEPREQRLLGRFHDDNPTVQTLSFSSDGLTLIASLRSQTSGGTIQVYIWKYPFEEPSEVAAGRYRVPLHESEDNGVTAAIFRPKTEADECLICITTWTQSGPPMLVQPGVGHKTEIKAAASGRHRRALSRVQTAEFSPSGKHLAMVNDKGNLYQISQINSSLMQTKKLATSRELTTKSDSFAMVYMTLDEEESIVLAWTEPSGVAYVKKVPVSHTGDVNSSVLGDGGLTTHSELPAEYRSPSETRAETSATFSPTASSAQPETPGPVELAATDMSVSFNMRRR